MVDFVSWGHIFLQLIALSKNSYNIAVKSLIFYSHDLFSRAGKGVINPYKLFLTQVIVAQDQSFPTDLTFYDKSSILAK